MAHFFAAIRSLELLSQLRVYVKVDGHSEHLFGFPLLRQPDAFLNLLLRERCDVAAI